MKIFNPKMVVLLVSIIPSAATACPTREDVGEGIRIEHNDGTYEIYTRLDDHLVSSVFYSESGKRRSSRITSYGVFETEITYFDDVSGGQKASYQFTYSFDPSDYSPISEVSSIRGRQFEVTDFGKRFTDRYHVHFGSAQRVQIGDCVYAGIPVSITYGSWWDQDESRGAYFPELGIFLERDVYNPAGIQWMRDASIAAVSK